MGRSEKNKNAYNVFVEDWVKIASYPVEKCKNANKMQGLSS
jgi:hypothetical protein